MVPCLPDGETDLCSLRGALRLGASSWATGASLAVRCTPGPWPLQSRAGPLGRVQNRAALGAGGQIAGRDLNGRCAEDGKKCAGFSRLHHTPPVTVTTVRLGERSESIYERGSSKNLVRGSQISDKVRRWLQPTVSCFLPPLPCLARKVRGATHVNSNRILESYLAYLYLYQGVGSTFSMDGQV